MEPADYRLVVVARALAWMLLGLVFAAGGSGCAQTNWIRMREVPSNPLAGPLKLLSPSGPQPTPRTMLLLRRYSLEDDLDHNTVEVLSKLYEINRQEPAADKLYSISELAYLSAKRAEPISRRRALELYGVAVVNAYNYLFDERFGRYRNPYDPEFRGSCDLYNGALESVLRIIQKRDGLVPGQTHTIETANQQVAATIVLAGRWHPEDIAEYRFVSDYDVRGLQNQYHNYGLGVPLIAVLKHHDNPTPEEKFYPPGMSVPVTAFMRVMPASADQNGQHVVHIELHDPLNTADINIGGRPVPLENDLSTPLAYALNQKELQNLDSPTAGFLNPVKAEGMRGLYMLEPYQPGKIPVLMIHGIWSSPVTWVEMFNDLRASPEIRNRYQFWFYLYPTGQPFWDSARELRSTLAEARNVIDPQRRQPALDNMVLVGHSMGGLLAEMQVIDSRNDFWNAVSEKPFQLVNANDETRAELASTYFFQPNQSVRRVITIGTPFRGSQFANSTTRWLGSKLITLPQMMIKHRQQLHKDNPDILREPNPIDVETSLDSLAPDSPLLPVVLSAQRAGWVRHHNIVGRVPDKGFLGRVAGEGDGVVSFASAHLDGVASEIVVNADHSEVHRHPLSVLEVHRILLEHLTEVDGPAAGDRWTRLPQTTAAAPGHAPR